MDLYTLDCCALTEISGISEVKTPREALVEIIETEITQSYSRFGKGKMFAYGALLFTQASPGTYGTKLAQFIRRERLGTVTEVPRFKNPNTGNEITLFVWKINRKAIQKWWEENGEDEE